MECAQETGVNSQTLFDFSKLRSPGEVAKISSELTSGEYSYYFRDSRGNQIHVNGCRHSYNIDEGNLIEIQRKFENLQPNIILVEGSADLRSADVSIDTDPLKVLAEHGEQTYIAFLARKAGIEVKSWDIPLKDLVVQIKDDFNSEAVVGYLIAIAIKHIRDAKLPQVFDSLRRIFEIGFGGFDELEKIFGSSFEEERIQQIIMKYAGKSFSEVTYEEAENLASPGKQGETNLVIRRLNELRDKNAINRIALEKQRHEKIFVTAGQGHAIVWEPVLRQMYS